MLRDYASGVSSTPVLFVGAEVEKTRHFGEMTLFVVDLNTPIIEIANIATGSGCTHIYLAANHNYPAHTEVEWINACTALKMSHNVTLEVQHKDLTPSLIDLSQKVDFVLMVGCPIPNIHSNIVVKVDDVDFRATNPGVWTIMPFASKKNRAHFTPWDKYTQDKVIK